MSIHGKYFGLNIFVDHEGVEHVECDGYISTANGQCGVCGQHSLTPGGWCQRWIEVPRGAPIRVNTWIGEDSYSVK